MWSSLPPGKRRAIVVWLVGLVLVYGALTAGALSVIEGEKQLSAQNHALRMSADRVEIGLTPPDPLPPGGDFVPVTIGMYIDSVETFSIRDSFWTASFYVWFRWNGDKALDPAKSFQLIDARIEKKELVDQWQGDHDDNYQRIRVSARIIKFFDTTRVPLDDHLLTISAEDAARDATKLRYVLDPDTNISSRMRVPGYVIANREAVVKSHTYRSTYGDPRVPAGTRKTFTELVFGIHVKRASMGLYFKSLLGLFAGVVLTLASFFIRPADTSPRFSLPTASYFGAVANSYLANAALPSTGHFGLVDYVSGFGLFTIFVCLAASLVSGFYYIVKKDEVFSRAIDRSTRAAVAILYVLANLALPISAFTGV